MAVILKNRVKMKVNRLIITIVIMVNA